MIRRARKLFGVTPRPWCFACRLSFLLKARFFSGAAIMQRLLTITQLPVLPPRSNADRWLVGNAVVLAVPRRKVRGLLDLGGSGRPGSLLPGLRRPNRSAGRALQTESGTAGLYVPFEEREAARQQVPRLSYRGMPHGIFYDAVSIFLCFWDSVFYYPLPPSPVGPHLPRTMLHTPCVRALAFCASLDQHPLTSHTWKRTREKFETVHESATGLSTVQHHGIAAGLSAVQHNDRYDHVAT